MDLILFGMQGSGKGTQSQIIAKRCGYEIFETGAELRRLASEDSDLGRKVKSIMDMGQLVPTEVVMEIISHFMARLPQGTKVLFDGIPRSTDQQIQFDQLMLREGRNYKALLIKLTEGEALNRLIARRLCKECKTVVPASYGEDTCPKCSGELMQRSDDTHEAIRVRIDTFMEKTIPVIDSYNERNLLMRVNGEQSINEVTIDIIKLLKDHGIECVPE